MPTIETERLVLRPFRADDARDVQRLAGDREIASTTLLIPHPYPDDAAAEWIASHRARFEKGEGLELAVVTKHSNALIGAAALRFVPDHAHAELGYWIGTPHWNEGYCTEAARALVAYAFDEHAVHRVFARHLARNPASGRVLAKIGMRVEGTLRGHVMKWGVFEDLVFYGILVSDPRG